MAQRTAFVTGGASGLGAAIAERLAAEGFSVVVGDIDEAGGRAKASEIGGSFVRCDVSDIGSVREAVPEALDLLVNNAGFDEPAFFLDTDPELWQRLVAVNLMGVLNCTHAAAPRIAARARETGYGRIVNVASDAGRVGSLGEAAYAAAKGGVIAFTKSMARELARDRITVNAVCPGPADTPMTDGIRMTELGDKLMDRMIRATPLRRLAAPEDVAAAVAYFASEGAGFVTAQVLSVSGGLTIPG